MFFGLERKGEGGGGEKWEGEGAIFNNNEKESNTHLSLLRNVT